MSTGRSKTRGKTDDVDFLLKTNEEQSEQITRLQAKFRDVTHAYRSLLEEKKALEITIKALKTTNKSSFLNTKLADIANRSKHGSRSDLTGLQNSSRTPSVSDLSEMDVQSTSDSADLDSSNPKIPQNFGDLNQEEKINALTANIQLLIDSKSKLERGFQGERKKWRDDKEEMKTKFETVKSEMERNGEVNEQRLKEMRMLLKKSQAERDKLNGDINMMAKSKSAEQENKIISIQEENQAILQNLRNENNNLKQKFKNYVKQFENKCEEVAECSRELVALKSTHAKENQQHEDVIADLRERLSHTQNSSELRIGSLEAKINELCTIISQYEVGESVEKYIPVKLSGNKESGIVKKSQFETPDDFDSAIEQMQNLKSFIETTAKELNISFNFNEIWFQSDSNLEKEKEESKKLAYQIDKLKEENRHLKEEYEKYKIRTNYLIKSAKQTSKETLTNHEAEQQLKKAIEKYKEEVDILNKRIQFAAKDRVDEIRSLTSKFEQQESVLRAEFKVKMEKVEHERLERIGEMEKELVKQRERTLKLLDERGDELNKLKGAYNKSPQIQSTPSRTLGRSNSLQMFEQKSPNTNQIPDSADTSQEENDLLTRINQSSEQLSPENHIIHYSQESAYKDMELNKLRVYRNELEYKLKQTHDEHSVEIERFQGQISVLKEEIERLNLAIARDELNCAGDELNLEYVKNVVFNFMTTKDRNVRASMQEALTQILKFTKLERQKLKSCSS